MLFCTVAMNAQEDLKEKMNALKMNPEYYWADMTSDTREAATADAVIQLVETLRANDFRVTEEQLQGKTEFIYIPRGERMRAFVYIKKDKVAAAVSAPVAVQQQPVAAQVTPHPATVAMQKPTPVQVTQQPVAAQTVNERNAVGSYHTLPASVLMTLSQCEMGTDVFRCLQGYQRDGTISGYGKVTSREQLGDNNYLVMYDDDEVVRAILAPANGRERKNIATGNADSTQNYKGCRVLWFK